MWTSTGQDGDGIGVFGQRFDSAGTPLAPGGNIAAQRYDSGGTPLGGNFFVNTVLSGPQYRPALAMDASGRFLVAFEGDDFDGAGVLAQTFRADGTKIDEEFFVNILATNDQGNAVATASPAGHFIIAWSENDGDTSGVFARRFNSAAPSCPGLTAFSEEELGDPEAGLTAFAFCVYRDNGVTDLLVDATIPAEGICEGSPCWKARQTKTAFKYKDADPDADGITQMGLRSGAIGRGKMLVKGGGPSLGVSLPVGPFNAVTVQLINGNGECWQSVYDTAIANTVKHFKAK